MTSLAELVYTVFIVFGLIMIAITFAIRKQNKAREAKIEENKTSKSPAETLTEEFEETYKRTGDPGLGIILQFRRMDAEIEKLRGDNRQNKN